MNLVKLTICKLFGFVGFLLLWFGVGFLNFSILKKNHCYY